MAALLLVDDAPEYLPKINTRGNHASIVSYHACKSVDKREAKSLYLDRAIVKTSILQRKRSQLRSMGKAKNATKMSRRIKVGGTGGLVG